MSDISIVRSALFVPGDRPERFEKALATAADVVIIDFEDAVEASRKAQARDNLDHFLREQNSVRVVVRINAADHPEHLADVAFCASQSQVRAVMLPKAENRGQLDFLGRRGLSTWPLIETVKGIQCLAEVASGVGVKRLTYGALDFGVELGLKSGTAAANRMLDQMRFQILLHSKLAGLARPVETVFPDISDLDGLTLFAQDATNMGFEGMLCIHPKQVAVANRTFSPTQTEIEWASKVLEASISAPGAFTLDGKMIDAPVIAHARRLLDCSRLK